MRPLLALLALAALVAAVLFLLLDSAPVEPVVRVERTAPADDERAAARTPVPAPEGAGTRREGLGPGAVDAADGPDPTEAAPVSVEEEEPSVATRLTVVWRGPGGDACTALAVPEHHTFINGLHPRDEDDLVRARLVPSAPDVAAATFEGLEQGSWSIGVRAADGSERWAAAALHATRPEVVVEFGAGPSGVRGTVWDESGRPIEGATITVQCPGAGRGTTALRARTGADGRYELTGLHGGAGWFSAAGPPASGGEELADHVLSIPSDGERVVDVGSPVGLATVRLEVVDVAGEPLYSGSVVAIAPGGSSSVDGRLGDSGRVELALTPATWSLQLWSLDGNHGVVGELDVVGGGVIDHRLQLAGGRILGELQWPEGEPEASATGRQRMTLRTGVEPTSPAVGRSNVDPTGRFRFDTVAPGTYWLTGSPRGLASPVSVTLVDRSSSARVTVPLEAP